jgi:hypothetical protein
MLNAAQIHFLSQVCLSTRSVLASPPLAHKFNIFLLMQRPLDEMQEVAEFTRVAKRLKEKDKPSE